MQTTDEFSNTIFKDVSEEMGNWFYYSSPKIQCCKHCGEITPLGKQVRRGIIGNAYYSVYECGKCGNNFILDESMYRAYKHYIEHYYKHISNTIKL